MFIFIGIRNATPPQNRQHIVYYKSSDIQMTVLWESCLLNRYILCGEVGVHQVLHSGEWCGRIKLSNLLLPRKSGTIDSFQLRSTSETLLALGCTERSIPVAKTSITLI